MRNRKLLLLLLGLSLVFGINAGVSQERSPEGLSEKRFRLNQFELEEKLARFSTSRPFKTQGVDGGKVQLVSTSRDNVPPQNTALPNTITWDNPKSVFEYVFFRLPEHAVVYPTETYYYYAFDADVKSVAGNFRFVDAADGVLHIGYFDRKDPHSSLGGSGSFGIKDGVAVKMIAPFLFEVRYQGIAKYFSLNPTATVLPSSLQLLPDEVFVSRIFDESGFEFVLLFNEKTDAFYYVTNNELSFPDERVQGPRGYLLAKNSSFVFYEDSPRKRLLLVGIHEKNVYMNSYYDGPFDQVPPRLDIQSQIYQAYPYTKWRGGIDKHGNFINTKDTRVAISPYTPYRSLAELYEYQSRCFKGEYKKTENSLLSCLAYEWKMDFHKWGRKKSEEGYDAVGGAPAENRLIPIFVKQGWPANHYGEASSSWPMDHEATNSRGLPPNFTFAGESNQAALAEPFCNAPNDMTGTPESCKGA